MHDVPLWSGGSYSSPWTQKMEDAKRRGDDQYWPVMQTVLNYDYHTLPLERFKVWSSVWNVPFVHSHIPEPYVWEYLHAIRHTPYGEQYRAAVQEPLIGCTEADLHDHLSLFMNDKASATRVQHLAHLLMCGYTPDVLSRMSTIVEIGSGIGEMPDIIYKLGFTGTYYILDLPEVSQLQRWYHTQLGHTKIVHTNTVHTLPVADLCIATWSFTEMPLAVRADLVRQIGQTSQWLIAYSRHIFGIDNEQYLTNVFLSQIAAHSRQVTHIPIPFMPWNGGTQYLTIRP